MSNQELIRKLATRAVLDLYGAVAIARNGPIPAEVAYRLNGAIEKITEALKDLRNAH